MKVQAVVLKKVSKLSRSKRKLTASVKSNANGAEWAQSPKDRIEQWIAKYHLVVDSLTELTKASDALRDEVDEWNEIEKRMLEQYEETNDEMNPVVIKKVWVSNVN